MVVFIAYTSYESLQEIRSKIERWHFYVGIKLNFYLIVGIFVLAMTVKRGHGEEATQRNELKENKIIKIRMGKIP